MKVQAYAADTFLATLPPKKKKKLIYLKVKLEVKYLIKHIQLYVTNGTKLIKNYTFFSTPKTVHKFMTIYIHNTIFNKSTYCYQN